MNPKRILLVYPKLGMSGALVKHMPLSLLYTAVDALKAGFAVDILDVRLHPQHWQEQLAAKITPDTFLVGVSVMTGAPIKNALDISRWVKANHPQLQVVWGGPHATFNGHEILDTPEVDFVVVGYGSQPLGQLALNLSQAAEAPALNTIAGLLYRENGQVVGTPAENHFEVLDYRDIPYHLIEADLDQYGQLDSGKRIFSLYSVMGCPYQCAFCSSPAQYRNIPKKYSTLLPADVVNHIEYVHQRYGANYIYFIDDDSFVNLGHVEAVIDELNRRGLKVGLGFRGARINEIKKMSDEYLSKLAAAGTDIFHIGAESGSQKILDLIRKNCTVADIIAVNQKMARHPEIKTGYNWIVGLPGETMEDLRQTQQLMLRLIADNPSAIVFIPNKFRPLPGTELYELALQNGYNKPTRLEDWLQVEAEGSAAMPWCPAENMASINMMQVTSYFVDNKAFKVDTGRSWKYQLIRLLSWLYKPIAVWRLRHNVTALLIEDQIFRWFSAFYRL
jgi:anaerobic magnesium-protoporphyrin IX monomethyl ester cyclase